MVISPGEIDLTEAIITFTAFPVLVILAYMADQGCGAAKNEPALGVDGDGGIQLSVADLHTKVEANDLEESGGQVEQGSSFASNKSGNFDTKEAKSLLAKENGSSDQVAAQKVAQTMTLQRKQVSPMLYTETYICMYSRPCLTLPPQHSASLSR
jgi:hypothetical protein